MKNFFGSIAWAVWGLIIVAVLVFGSLFINSYAYPWWLSVQRKSVEQSKSFTDANNNMLATYIQAHAALDTKIAEAGDDDDLIVAYRSQQQAILYKMCLQISTMSPGTVNPSTLSWINSNGGCQ